MSTKYLAILFATVLVGCGGEGSDKNLPSITSFDYEIISTDRDSGTATIHVMSEISGEISVDIYDNNQQVFLDSGDVRSGEITLSGGRHNMKICADNNDGQVCSDELLVIVSENLEISSYYKYPLAGESMAVSNNGENIIYITRYGSMYSLDLTSEVSTHMKDIQNLDDGFVNGLANIDDSSFYYSRINSYNGNAIYLHENDTNQQIASLPFPDGLDYVDGYIYAVTNDASEEITVLDSDGEHIAVLKTGIDDIVGISHSSSYLYVLAEDGSIYQTDKVTGSSIKVFTNDNLFANTENGTYGVEGITILNNRIYISYINDISLYLIDIDISDYE